MKHLLILCVGSVVVVAPFSVLLNAQQHNANTQSEGSRKDCDECRCDKERKDGGYSGRCWVETKKHDKHDKDDCDKCLATRVSFDLIFPSGYGLSGITVGASRSIEIGEHAEILDIDGFPGTLTNAYERDRERHREQDDQDRDEDAIVKVRSDAKLGSAVSIGDIRLDDRDVASVLRSSGTVHLEKNDSVGSVTQKATLTPLVHRPLMFTVPAGDLPSIRVAAKGAKSIAPGAYHSVSVESSSTLTLSAGQYIFNSFDLDHEAVLKLNTSRGSVKLYIRESLEWKGSVSGDTTRFVLAYVGHSTVRLNPGFSGTALVPNAQLRLERGDDPDEDHSVYHGVFYGKKVVVESRVTVQRAATPLLIGGLTVSNTNLCVGQQTEVNLTTLTDASIQMTPWIQGTASNHQFVEFAGQPGPRWVYASVFAPNGRADAARTQVNVQNCAASNAPHIGLHFGPSMGKPNVVELMVHGYDNNGYEALPAGLATFVWTFGDGQTATTNSPLVSHDYTQAINPLAPYSYFTASVTMTTANGTARAQKVIPIWSLYASNRAKGVIQPPSSISVSPGRFTLSVRNYEPTPISINQARVELIPCDPAFGATRLPIQALSVVIQASSSGNVDVTPPGPFGKDICSVGVHLVGAAPAGTVYSDGYGRVAKENPLLRQQVTDPTTVDLLNQASTQTADPNQFNYSELRQLYARGLLPRLPPAIPPGNPYSNVGEECTPGDTQAGLVCQPTRDWVANPPEFLNGFKGDFIMDHGCGSIGQLLSAVGQLYSHTEMVTKNRVEVRHSTMTADRLNDSVDYVGMELDPRKMRFGFPGTQGASTFSADQIVHQYCVSDPDGNGGSSSQRNCDSNGKCDCPDGTWRMGGELDPYPGKCDQDVTPVSPLVIRPEPDSPQPDLQSVVDAGLGINSHYRFFMYSHAETLLPGGPSGWSANTVSTVCSSFEREAASKAGFPLWPTRSAADGVPDGMRKYNTDERTAGANALWSNTYDSVMANPSWIVSGLAWIFLPGYLPAMADNIGDQLANCFATDSCADLGDSWENPGEGIAVSPDDVAHWDTHQNGGTYGYDEPLEYLEVSFRHKYAWATAGGDGSMTVTVVDDKGNPPPPPDATIILNDNDLVGTTASDGTLKIPNLPSGPYNVAAQLYEGPPLPQPPTPVLDSNDKILALRSCPNDLYCQVPPDAACPSGYAEYDTTPVLCNDAPCDNSPTQVCAWAGQSDSNGDTQIWKTACVCQATSTPPPPSCNFWHANRPAVVNATQDTKVLLTLCLGAVCDPKTGVPGTCAQYCNSDADCDNTQSCTPSGSGKNKCVPKPTVVRITSEGADGVTLQVFDNGGLGSSDRQTFHPAIDMICDPNADPVNGGKAYFSHCGTAGSVDSELQFTVYCHADSQGTGGIIVDNDLRLVDGCGGDDEADATGAHNIGVAPNASVLWLDESSCYSDDVFPPSNVCTENEALLHRIRYTNQPK
jgi:hypothetical protein